MSLKTKILFILKRREDFDPTKHTKEGMQTGLFNSATFVKDMLNESGIESKLFIARDNNDIDREVTAFRPTHVIIEALWVVPQKFDIPKSNGSYDCIVKHRSWLKKVWHGIGWATISDTQTLSLLRILLVC